MDYSPYTDHPGADPTVVFPRESLRLLCLIALLLALSTILFILGRRTSQIKPFEGESWTSLSIARVSCLMVWVLSAGYVFGALVLTFGTGLSKSPHTCDVGSLLCLCLYTVSKFWIYLFLLEKVRIVQAVKISRMRSKSYLAMLTMLSLPCLGILILMIFGRRTDLNGHGVCHMGLELYSSLPVLGFDVVLVAFLTVKFSTPLLQSSTSPSIRRVAIKSLVAALTSIIGTAGNIIFLTIERRKLSWLCLLSCTLDVFASALVLFFVTMRTDGEGTSNGNQEREQRAIRALVSSKNPLEAGDPVRAQVDHLDMMEALAGELFLTEAAARQRPHLCRCSSSCLSAAEAADGRSTLTHTTAAELASVRRESLTLSMPSDGKADDVNKSSGDSAAPVAALSYQAPSSSGTESGSQTPSGSRRPQS